MGLVFSTIIIFYGIIFLLGKAGYNAWWRSSTPRVNETQAEAIVRYVENKQRFYKDHDISFGQEIRDFNAKYKKDDEFREQVTDFAATILDETNATFNNLPAKEAFEVWDSERRVYPRIGLVKTSMDLIRDIYFINQGKIDNFTVSCYGFGGWMSAPPYATNGDYTGFYNWAKQKFEELGFYPKIKRDVYGIVQMDVLGDEPKTFPKVSDIDTAYILIKNKEVKRTKF